ncbi:acetylornithine transaminase [Cutibacterium sp. WCA-380-WT-3A]|uniref:Acetylornithine transaminase n=1 Tax=Cutibacterium porci TaxID=2605781 RepID=A0A7K0J620_9ACTN|nr:acetylornithine transaminase [Cutibacterium porci]MSS45268.1 acetylornithine transaminase [Cutibacterium porci]
MIQQSTPGDWQERYHSALLGVFGSPQLCLDHGYGCIVVDSDGNEYLDLLGGIAVNALGYAHPAWVKAVTHQAETLAHVSNFFTTRPQLDLAEKMLSLAKAPEGSAVFFSNSGTEANEAAIKICLARKNGRIIALDHAFHGRTLGALALTHKAAYRQPFGPSAIDVTFVAPDDHGTLCHELDKGDVSAVFVEPVQGEAGVVPLSREYLRQVRELTVCHDALMVVDEVQCGMGRTGRWFAHQGAHITPDVMTTAKALGGGFPIGATVTFGPHVSGVLTAGQHGTTFGGNALACAVACAVISTIESDDLLAHVRKIGALMSTALQQCHPSITQVRGSGALLGIQFDSDIAGDLVVAARDAGFIVNAANPSTLRLAPPYVLTEAQAQSFVDALPGLIDSVRS